MITFHLKELAEPKGLNRHQLSLLIGVSYPTITKYWENRAESFDAVILDKLCALLECQPGDLIKWTGQS